MEGREEKKRREKKRKKREKEKKRETMAWNDTGCGNLISRLQLRTSHLFMSFASHDKRRPRSCTLTRLKT